MMDRMLTDHVLKMILRNENTEQINKMVQDLTGTNPKITDSKDVIINNLYAYHKHTKESHQYFDITILLDYMKVVRPFVKEHSLKDRYEGSTFSSERMSPYVGIPYNSFNTDTLPRALETTVLVRNLASVSNRICIVYGSHGSGKTSLVQHLGAEIDRGIFKEQIPYTKIYPVNVRKLQQLPVQSPAALTDAFESIKDSVPETGIVFLDDFDLFINSKYSEYVADILLQFSKERTVILTVSLVEHSDEMAESITELIASRSEIFHNKITQVAEYLLLFPPTMHHLHEIIKRGILRLSKHYNVKLEDININTLIALSGEAVRRFSQPDQSIYLLESVIVNKCILSDEQIKEYCAQSMPIVLLEEVDKNEFYFPVVDYPDKRRNIVTMDDIEAYVASDVYVAEVEEGYVSAFTPKRRDDIITRLNTAIVGQQQAKEDIADAIANLVLFNTIDRTIGQFLFVGPSGTGKTAMAKAIANAVYGNKNRLLRLNMNEYTQSHQVAKLVGAPPGYIGYGDSGGQLSRVNDFSSPGVLLIDEIEKAHPDIYKYFLSLFEDGEFKNDAGTTISVAGWLIIMTSNLGSSEYSKVGVGYSKQENVTVFHGAVKKHFPPEFYNRINKVITFEPHTKETLIQVGRSQFHTHITSALKSSKGINMLATPDLWENILANITSEEIKKGGRHTLECIDTIIKPSIVQAYNNNKLDNIQALYAIDFIDNEVQIVQVQSAKKLQSE